MEATAETVEATALGAAVLNAVSTTYVHRLSIPFGMALRWKT